MDVGSDDAGVEHQHVDAGVAEALTDRGGERSNGVQRTQIVWSTRDGTAWARSAHDCDAGRLESIERIGSAVPLAVAVRWN